MNVETRQDYFICPYCDRNGAYVEGNVEKCKFCGYLRREGETFLANLNPWKPQSIKGLKEIRDMRKVEIEAQ